MQPLPFLNDPIILTTVLMVLFLINGVLTIGLAFKSLDPVRAEGLCVVVLSVVVFLLCANLDQPQTVLLLIQGGQLVLLIVLNFLFRREPVRRGR